MHMQRPVSKLLRSIRLNRQLFDLPAADLLFRLQLAPQQVNAAFRRYAGPHPKYESLRNKSMGMALIDLSFFDGPATYLETVDETGWAGPPGQQARLRGYTARAIDRDRYHDEIANINQLPDQLRQGRPLDMSWLQPAGDVTSPCAVSFGAFNQYHELVAYCTVGVFGNFASVEELIGYKNRDGVMYLLLTEIICELLAAGTVQYFMYGSFVSASAGKRKFKRRLGFVPYRVRYALD
ncbi:hypothetical protein [Massilia horti]|uniref:Uncharacterized protein n=1 Tax=Massilia horti TaxID=2562153 RepID=A0A4Y9SP05_9BURK|nr:hypothetical protein [Massilia horti]TFW28460.1 hypothetical protein E4O92_21350 [Massilia horti]